MNRNSRKQEFRQAEWLRRLIAIFSAFVLLFSSTGTVFAQDTETIYSAPVTVPARNTEAPEETPAPVDADEEEPAGENAEEGDTAELPEAGEGGETEEEIPEENPEDVSGIPADGQQPDAAEGEETAEGNEENPEGEADEEAGSDLEPLYFPGTLTAETEEGTIRIDYPAIAHIPEDAVLTCTAMKGAELYSALKSAAKLIRNEENAVWQRQVANEGNRFWLPVITDAEGNEIQPQTRVTVTFSAQDAPKGAEWFLAGDDARVLEAEDGTVTIADYTMEPFGYAMMERVQIGTVTQEYSGSDYTVTASYGPEAGFPENTEMKVREIKPGTPEYALYSGMTEEALGEDWTEITLERYFDITFISGSEELEPQADVDVQIIFRDVIELTEEHDVQAVHIENQEAVVIESETESNEDDAKWNSEAIDTVSFTSDSFSVFGVVQRKKITQKVLAADGNTYEINVTYGQEAGLPADAELIVTELLPGDERYEACLRKAMLAAYDENDGETSAETKAEDLHISDNQYARFFDIEIRTGEQKIEPEDSVSVSITLADAPEDRLDDLMVVHFTGDNANILDADIDAETGIKFATDSFSVYGVITYPDAQPQGENDLDGRSFTVYHSDGYMTSNVVTSNPDYLEKTQNAGNAAEWVFESTGEDGKYNIYTIRDGSKKYLAIDRRGDYWGNAVLKDTPQAFTVTKNSDGTYNLLTTSTNNPSAHTEYYLSDRNNNGFKGFHTEPASGNEAMTLNFQNELSVENSTPYITLVKYNGKYYIVNNTGSLTEVSYDPVTKMVSTEDPLLWQYQSDWQGSTLSIVTEGKTFNGPGGTADSYYNRYIDANADSGIFTEDADHSSGDSESRFVFENNHIRSADGSNCLGVELNADGVPVRIAGNKTAGEAVEVLFASVVDVTVPSHYARNHAVTHLDVSIHGNAQLDYPLPRGTYYDENGNELYTIGKDNPKSITIREAVPITKEDIKNADIIATDKNGNEIDNAFYVTGYTGNEGDNDPNMPTQIRIEGSFLVASNVTTDYPDEWTGEEDEYWGALEGNSTHQAIRQQRKNSEITYTVTTTKMVEFTLTDGDQVLYDKNGQPITVEVPVTMTGSCSYWSRKNTCPGIYYNGGFGENGPWDSGCIVGNGGNDSSGIDFTLGGSTKQEANAYPSVDITKYIIDENGTLLSTSESFQNSFTVYQLENSSLSSDCNTDYSAYSEEAKLAVSVAGGIGKNYYDLNVTGAMVYIEEDKDSIPQTVTVNGAECHYVKTVIETEYVRRGSANEPNHRTNELTLEDNVPYNSIPELAGAYRYNNEDRNNAILNFYVYNIYSSVTEIEVSKNWSDNAEHYENDSITLQLIRYKKDAPLPPEGTLNITHAAAGLDNLPDGFTVTYSYTGPESATNVPAGSYTVTPGEYTVTATVTNDAAPEGSAYAGTNSPITVNVPEDGSGTAAFISTYTEDIVYGTINLVHNVNGTNSNTVPNGFVYTATNTSTGQSYTLQAGENTLPLGNYTITVNDNNVSHPTGYVYSGTTVSGSPVNLTRSNPSGTVTVTSNYTAQTYRLTIRTTHPNDPDGLVTVTRYYTAGTVVTVTFNGGSEWWTPYAWYMFFIANGQNMGSISRGRSFQITMNSDVDVELTNIGWSEYENTVLGDKMTISPPGSNSAGLVRTDRKPMRLRAEAGVSSGGNRAHHSIPEGYGIDEEGYMTFTLNRGENWTTLLENLPVLDERGEPYYYAIEEVSVPGYTTSYSPSSPVIATQAEAITMTVTNTLQEEYVTDHYTVTVNKTDGTNPLAGAVFELYKEAPAAEGSEDSGETEGTANITVIKTYTMGEDTSFEIRTDDEDLADLLPAAGESVTLKLKETSAPEGYKPAEDIWEVVITTSRTSAWNSDHTAWTTTTVYDIRINGQNILAVPNKVIRDISVTKLVTDQGTTSELMNEKTIRVGLFMGDEAPEAGAEPLQTAEMTIAGSTTSELLFTALEPGTYWVRELDENGRMMPDSAIFTVHNGDTNSDDIYTVHYPETPVTLEDPGDVEATTITNNREGTGSLTVEKMLAGDGAVMTDVFDFTVTQTSSPKISGDYGGMHFEDGVSTFTLGHEESRTATGLPYGFTYTVTETQADEDGYLTVIDTVSNLTTETEGEDGELVVTDEADAFIKTDETETVTVTNTKLLLKSIRVTKEWMGIPYEETANYPAVSFALWQTDGNGWGHASPYTGEEGDTTDYSHIVLDYAHNWTWECPVELPEEDDNGGEYRYFVVETPVEPQNAHGTGEWVLTNPAYDDFVIKIDGYQYREVKDAGRWSELVQYQQPRQAAVPSHGEIKILNKMPGYIQMDLKKKFLDYRTDPSGVTSLYTTTGETENMRNMIIELQLMRRIVYHNSQTGQDEIISEGWEEYGVPFKVGYDAGGTPYVDNDNPFRVENSGGSWHFQVVENNRNHGLPKYGLYKRGENDIIVVKYQYLFKETQVYDGSLNPIGGQWVAWLPWAKDAESGRMFEVSSLQTAQDQDRMLNAPGSTLKVEKEWIGSARNVQEVYVRVTRRELGTTGDFEDYLAVINREMELGGLSQDHFGSNDAPVFDRTRNLLVLNAENDWNAIIDKVQVFPNGNNQKQYEYRITEIGYKDKNGDTHFNADDLDIYEPAYYRWGESDSDWQPQQSGLPLTVNGPNKLKVTNTSPYGALEIIKEVPEASTDAAESKTFTFTVELTLPEGSSFSEEDLSIEDGTISGFTMSGNSASFTVTRQGAGSAVVDGIPYGTTYTVTETNIPEGWEQIGGTVYSDSTQEVTRTDTETDQATVTNREITSVSVEKVWKLNGEEVQWPEGIASITAGLYQSVDDEEAQPVMDGETPKTLTFDKNTDEAGRIFSGLPVYDDDGNAYAYSIRELSVTTAEDPAQTFNVEDGTLTVTGTYAGTWTVTESEPDENGLVTFTNEQVKTDIHILKVDIETDPKAPLAGAEFRLYKKNTDDNTFEVVEQTITVGEEGEEKGRATITGLTDGTYRLAETKAPAGYIPLGMPINFNVTNGAVEFEDTDYVTYNADDQTFTVGNKAGLALPSTGGGGTLVYTAGGLGMILLAVILLLVRRKKWKNTCM